MSAPAAPTFEAYPCTWPSSQPRKDRYARRSAAFKADFTQARNDLYVELRRLGAQGVVVSTNVKPNRNGRPSTEEREPEDPAVAVYFTHGKTKDGHPRALVIACDTYSRVRWNMRACGVTVQALRTIQRHGATELLERAFVGFTAALPPKAGEARAWYEVLGVAHDANYLDAREAYRTLARRHHPDNGGDAEMMQRVNAAWAQAEERFVGHAGAAP